MAACTSSDGEGAHGVYCFAGSQERGWNIFSNGVHVKLHHQRCCSSTPAVSIVTGEWFGYSTNTSLGGGRGIFFSSFETGRLASFVRKIRRHARGLRYGHPGEWLGPTQIPLTKDSPSGEEGEEDQ